MLFIVFGIIIIKCTVAQNVGIGTTSPAASAKLDVTSTTQGFLLPRMTMAQRDSIVNPVAGLQIWCIERKKLQVYDGTVWLNIEGVADFQDVSICGQTWMLKNLNVVTYRNGDTIPNITDSVQWTNLTTGAWCWYRNDSANYASYGKLYNWYAVTDPRGLAPRGWHISTDDEWTTLLNCLGGDAATVGNKLKEVGTTNWTSNTGATNSTGFTALPAGIRMNLFSFTFRNIGAFAYFWTTTEFSATNAWLRYLENATTRLSSAAFTKPTGCSIRCVKD